MGNPSSFMKHLFHNSFELVRDVSRFATAFVLTVTRPQTLNNFLASKGFLGSSGDVPRCPRDQGIELLDVLPSGTAERFFSAPCVLLSPPMRACAPVVSDTD